MKKILMGITLVLLLLLTSCQQQPKQAEIDPREAEEEAKKAEKEAKTREVLPACSEATGIKQETIPEPQPRVMKTGEVVPELSPLQKGFCIDSDSSVYTALVGQDQCMDFDAAAEGGGWHMCVDKNGKVIE